MALANSRNILRSLWIKRLLVGCAKAHPASTQEVTQIQLLALSSLRRSSRFSMAPSASPSVVNSSPSTSPIPARMFVPPPKNSPALRALRSLYIHVYTRKSSTVADLPSPTSPIPWQPPISRWSLASTGHFWPHARSRP